MIKGSLFIFIFTVALSVGSVASVVISSKVQQQRIITLEQERANLEESLQLVVDWLLTRKSIHEKYSDETITIVDHSAKINPNYDNEMILRLPSVQAKILDIHGILGIRKEQLQLDYQPFIREEFSDFFTVYTHANPLTSDKNQLKMLYRMRTGRDLFPLRLEELINKEELISREAYLQSIQYDTSILSLIHPSGRFNVHTIEVDVLRDLLDLPLFNIQNTTQKLQRILSSRTQSQDLSVEQLKNFFTDEEELNELIFAYLGVSSFFYEINIKAERQSLHALIIMLPQEYTDLKQALIAWRRYLPNE